MKSPAQVGRGLLALALALSIACGGTDADRENQIAEILHERASHLQRAEREEIARGLVRAEQETGIDALLLLSLAEEESHYKPLARGRRGALGLMQVQPATARDVAERNRIPWKGPKSLFDPSVNIRIGAIYLDELHERFGTWDLALTAYNRGPTDARRAARRNRQPSSRYAARVLRRFESLPERGEKVDRNGKRL